MATFTNEQVDAIILVMRREFEAYQTARLEHRKNHVTSLVNDNGGSIDFIRLKQNAIHSIDAEITSRKIFLDNLINALNKELAIQE